MTYTTDKTIGSNLERLRGDMSMDMLAAKMRDRGYSWTKTTVFNIEHGKRPIRLVEAADVLECLKVEPASSVFELLRSDQENFWVHIVGLVSLAEYELQRSCEGYVNSLDGLKKFLDSDIASGDSKIINNSKKLCKAQFKVAAALGPCIQEILGFFEQNEDDKLPLVFLDGEFKRLTYSDFDKGIESQLMGIGMTDDEIEELKQRALKAETAKSGE